jgi:hypothetical protein
MPRRNDIAKTLVIGLGPIVIGQTANRITVLNGILAAPAAVSLAVGVRNVLRRSQDMHWSGSHLLGERIDPYLQFLHHDPEHRLPVSQVPNYLHELYLVMLPLGLLPFGAARALWVVAAFVPAAVGALIFWMIVHGSFLTVALEPFAVSHATGGVSDGTGDVMTLTMQISRHMAGVESIHLGIVLATMGSGVMAYVVARRRCTDVASFAALTCASLLLLVHLSYDFVLPAIPLAANLGAVERKQRWYGFALIGILLYVAPEVRRVLPHAPELAMTLFSFAMLAVSFVYFLPERSADSAPDHTSGLCPQN